MSVGTDSPLFGSDKPGLRGGSGGDPLRSVRRAADIPTKGGARPSRGGRHAAILCPAYELGKVSESKLRPAGERTHNSNIGTQLLYRSPSRFQRLHASATILPLRTVYSISGFARAGELAGKRKMRVLLFFVASLRVDLLRRKRCSSTTTSSLLATRLGRTRSTLRPTQVRRLRPPHLNHPRREIRLCSGSACCRRSRSTTSMLCATWRARPAGSSTRN